MPTERSATERHRSGLARWLGHRFVLRAADRCLGRGRLCPHRRGPRGLRCGARIASYPGQGAGIGSRRSCRRSCSIEAWHVAVSATRRGTPQEWARCTSARSVTTRRPTRSPPGSRSGCPRCIGADASDPFEVVPLRAVCTVSGPSDCCRQCRSGRRAWRGESCKRRRPGPTHPCLSPMSSGETTVLSEGT
jgi:hypothetical protein